MRVKKTGMGIDPYPLQPRALRAKWTTFRQSKTNYQGVRAMQYLLKYDGFLNDKADGYFGANTLAAVKAAQRHYGLVVDGVCGTNTWNKLVYLVSRSTYSSKKNISLAAKYVLSARYGYRVLDYNNYVYDTQTEACVADFQRKSGVINISGITSGVVGHTTWRYLVGSDKDLSLGKGFGGGSGSSSSGDDSSGGGSGGDKTYLPYPATAVGMAEYAYSKVGLNKTQLGFKESDSWCTGFIEYCARNVGYRINNLGFLTDTSRGLKPYNTSTINKGFTFFIRPDGVSGHYGMIWSKSSTKIVTIEANSDYQNKYRTVQRISYYWDSSRQVYYRVDRSSCYILKYMINY